MITVRAYHGDGIKEIYDKYIRDGVAIINKKCNEPINHEKYLKHIIEDDRYAVICFFNDYDYIGFAITIVDGEEKELFIHKGWGSWESHDYISVCLDIISHIAKRLGMRYVSFSSPRKAWSRVVDRYGFKASSVTYKRKI